jgi:hypothetical protein
MPVETNQEELTAAAEWIKRPIVTDRKHWLAEARVILRLRADGLSLRKIAIELDEIEQTPGEHNYETVNRRLAWAIELYRANT